jgi:hypothetical protein
MNVPSFEAQSPICPVCRRSGNFKSPKLLAGLLTCPHCRSRLVVSWSGHYVRDPFTLRQLSVEQSLRRGNHPLFRLWRQATTPRSLLLWAVLTSTLFIGMTTLFASNLVIRFSDPLAEPSIENRSKN